MQSVLIAAIEGRRLVSFWYDPGVRVVEPHALGYGSDGQLLLRAFQIEGASASNQHFNWKLFRLDRMRGASFNGRSFPAPRPEYKRDDRAMKRGIIAQL
jgi:predicted DNA-binding transcriptional regulator YafY